MTTPAAAGAADAGTAAPRLRALAVLTTLLSLMALVGALLPSLGATAVSGGGVTWAIPNLVVGALLSYRRPRLLTGWLFAAIGLLVSTGAAAETLGHAGTAGDGPIPWWGVLGAWYGEWYWLPLIYTTLVLLPLTFPDGRAPTPRFRRALIWTMVGVIALTVAAALQQTLDLPESTTPTPRIPNPIGIQGLPDVEEGPATLVLVPLMLTSLVATLAGVVVRFRASTGTERQQLKWFTSAVAMLIVGFILNGLIGAITGTEPDTVLMLLLALPPSAAAVAVLRYRLYAIDRIISRTVTYAVVTALLIGVYVAAVALMSWIIDPVAGDSAFAVAVATLAAAAAFRPARRRTQAIVDRRFNRARYDMERTLGHFRDRVRNDVDIDRLSADLVGVATAALQPRHVAVWLVHEQGRP